MLKCIKLNINIISCEMNLPLVIFVIYQIITWNSKYKLLSAISHSIPISIFHEISKKKKKYVYTHTYIFIYFSLSRKEIQIFIQNFNKL